jgi:hypothetical protein
MKKKCWEFVDKKQKNARALKAIFYGCKTHDMWQIRGNRQVNYFLLSAIRDMNS